MVARGILKQRPAQRPDRPAVENHILPREGAGDAVSQVFRFREGAAVEGLCQSVVGGGGGREGGDVLGVHEFRVDGVEVAGLREGVASSGDDGDSCFRLVVRELPGAGDVGDGCEGGFHVPCLGH